MPQGAIPFPFGDCKICCDKATGVHYGVATCEGCKGFFKRSIPKADKYKCFFGGQCQLSPQNRNRCKACRFQRCMDMGMSMDAVKMGRIPKVDKERALEANRGSHDGPFIDIGASLTDGHSPPMFEEGLFVKQEDASTMRPYDKSSPQDDHRSFADQLTDSRALLEGHHLHSPLTTISHAPLHNTVPPVAAHYSNVYNNNQDGHPLSNQDSGYSDGNNSDGGSPKANGDHGFPGNNLAGRPPMADYKFLQNLEPPPPPHHHCHNHQVSGEYNHDPDSLRFSKPHPVTGIESGFLSSLRDATATSSSSSSHHHGNSSLGGSGGGCFTRSASSSSSSCSTSTYSPTILKQLLSQVICSGQSGQDQILKYLSSMLPDHKALTHNIIAVLQSPQVLAELVPQLVATLTKSESQMSSLKRSYSDPGSREKEEGEMGDDGLLPHPPKVPALDIRSQLMSSSSSSSSPAPVDVKHELSALSELCNLVMEQTAGNHHHHQGGYGGGGGGHGKVTEKSSHYNNINRQYERSVSLDETSSENFSLCKVKQERDSPTTEYSNHQHHPASAALAAADYVFTAAPPDKGITLWDEVFKGSSNKAMFDDQEDLFRGNKKTTTEAAGDLSMKTLLGPRDLLHPLLPLDTGDKGSEHVKPRPGGSAENETMIISTLNKLSEAESLYCEKLRNDIESMLETISGRKRMHDLNYLSQATYRQVRIVWKSLFDDITNVNKMIISLCQAIPGFVKLDLTEQAKLMEDAYFDLWLILFSVLFVNNESYVRMCDNIHYTRFWMSHFLTDSLIEKMFNFCEQLNSLKLSRLEICVLCAIQLTHPDRSSKEEVRLLHSHFLDVLVYIIEKSHPVNHSRILVNLFRILPLLQPIQVEQTQVIGTFRAEKPPERCEAMVIVGSVEEELACMEAEKEEETTELENTVKTDSFCEGEARESTSVEDDLWSDSLQ